LRARSWAALCAAHVVSPNFPNERIT